MTKRRPFLTESELRNENREVMAARIALREIIESATAETILGAALSFVITAGDKNLKAFAKELESALRQSVLVDKPVTIFIQERGNA